MNQLTRRFFDEHDFITDIHDEHIGLFSCNQILRC